MAPDAIHEIGPSQDDTSLGPAEKLVAAEAADVDALGHGCSYRWLDTG